MKNWKKGFSNLEAIVYAYFEVGGNAQVRTFIPYNGQPNFIFPKKAQHHTFFYQMRMKKINDDFFDFQYAAEKALKAKEKWFS